MAKSYNYQPAGDVTVTSTGNIDDLDFSGCALIRMNNASDATIRGIKAGYPGQILKIASIGAGNVLLSNQNTGSSAANRLILFVTSANTPLAAGVGSATFQYDSVTARWRLIEHCQGARITVPYASGNFSANGAMTWTVDSGDQISYEYELYNDQLYVLGYFDTTSVGGTPNTALVLSPIPGGFTSRDKVQGTAPGFDNGVGTSTYARTLAGNTLIEIGRGDAGNWALSTNNTFIRVVFMFPVT